MRSAGLPLFAVFLALTAGGCGSPPGPSGPDDSGAQDAGRPDARAFDGSAPGTDASRAQDTGPADPDASVEVLRRGWVFSVDEDSTPLEDARILADGVEVGLTGPEGEFDVRLPRGATISIEANGHVPMVFGPEADFIDGVRVALSRLDLEVVIDPMLDSVVSDGNGLTLRIEAGSLVLPSGEVSSGPVTVRAAVLDPLDPEQALALPSGELLVGGERVPAPAGYVAYEITLRDAEGRELQPRAGSAVEVDVPAPDREDLPLEIMNGRLGDDGLWTESEPAIRTLDGSGIRVYRSSITHFSWRRGYDRCRWFSCYGTALWGSGRLVSGGVPVADARVAVWSHHGSYQWVLTGTDGRFRARAHCSSSPCWMYAYGYTLTGNSETHWRLVSSDVDFGDIELRPTTPGGVVCPGTQSDCSGVCVATDINASHCGGCGRACASGMSCLESACVCEGSMCAGSCVDTTRDDAHCGACGNACEDYENCAESVCVPEPCPMPYTRCGAECIDLTRGDPLNCGACGVVCTAAEVCEEGVCIVPPVCGDAMVGRGEVCDDGVNDGSYGTCNPGCASLAAYCGDGLLQPGDGEACDPMHVDGCPSTCADAEACTADALVGSGCTVRCAFTPITAFVHADGCCPPGADGVSDDDCPGVCGNGVVELGEVCDDGNVVSADGCSADCLSDETCGNGIWDRATEDCDDGNAMSMDGCTPDCRLEGCGNGFVEPFLLEMCDDGNFVDGDGCTADCSSDETCGNGRHDPHVGEVCDDANVVSGDGCSALCDSDESCGNGTRDIFEACDDGNAIGGDGCSALCDSDETCGNGFRDVLLGEACDDMNTTSGDGCSGDCGSVEICGNSIIDVAIGEVCDDGNTAATDGCSADCRSDESCGNGVLDASVGEACDDGNTAAADGCSAGCDSLEICGNAIVDATVGEICDDGNTLAADGCAADCRSNEQCGNGIVDAATGEVCDDGNVVAADGCSANCLSDESCGNGIVELAEACDDGNTVSGDGCAGDCSMVECTGAEFTMPGAPAGSSDGIYSVALNEVGDMLVVGAVRASTGMAGAVYVFRRIAGTWVFEARIDAPVTTSAIEFGTRVAASGSTIAAIVPAAHPGASRGAVYVYTGSGGTWTLQQRIVGPGLSGSTVDAVDVSGDTLALSEGQRLYIYGRTGTVWSQLQNFAPLANSAMGAGPVPINDLDLEGDDLIIGMPYHWVSIPFEGGVGIAHAYRRTAGSFARIQTFNRPGGALPSQTEFGFSVALSGSRLVIAEPGRDEVFIYFWSAGAWTLEQTVSEFAVRTQNTFGQALAIDSTGTRLVVSDPGWDIGGTNSGIVYVYDRVGALWSLTTTLREATPASFSFHGHSVGVHGSTVVTTVPRISVPGRVVDYALSACGF